MAWSLRKALGVETRASPEDPTIPVSSGDFLRYFGIDSRSVSVITPDNAMKVPAYASARGFLAASLANLPLHGYSKTGDTSKRTGGPLQRMLNEACNPEWSSYAARKYFWSGVFGERGRGLLWIERNATGPIALWPMDPTKTTVKRVGVRKVYEWSDYGQTKTYDAADVIDVPFHLKADQLSTHNTMQLAEKALQMWLAMNGYGAGYFAGGGVPPLAVEGPLPAGKEALGRAMADIRRAIEQARESDSAVFPMPPGHTLKPVGLEPDKGQMVEAFRFQVEEIARVFSLPPVFLQDLTHGTFTNTEQQDLQLAKHTVSQWAKALEDEMNLKLFPNSGRRYVEHSLDGLMRGDMLSRMQAHGQAVQNAIRTPNEVRALENLPPKDGGDDLLIQGATVPIGTQPKEPGAQPPANGGNQ